MPAARDRARGSGETLHDNVPEKSFSAGRRPSAKPVQRSRCTLTVLTLAATRSQTTGAQTAISSSLRQVAQRNFKHSNAACFWHERRRAMVRSFVVLFLTLLTCAVAVQSLLDLGVTQAPRRRVRHIAHRVQLLLAEEAPAAGHLQCTAFGGQHQCFSEGLAIA